MPVLLVIATMVSAVIVAWRFNWPAYVGIVGVPLLITGAISWWFGSWKPMIALSTTYLYFMAFWFIGYAAEGLQAWIGRPIAEAMDISWRWPRLVFYLVMWGVLIASIEFVLRRCLPDLPDSEEHVGDIPPHHRVPRSSNNWKSGLSHGS